MDFSNPIAKIQKIVNEKSYLCNIFKFQGWNLINFNMQIYIDLPEKSDSPRYKLVFTSVQNSGLLGEKYK